jgi:FdhD protein
VTAHRPAGPPTARQLVWEPKDGRLQRRPDQLAVEEPLEIRLGTDDGLRRVVTVTMRTPGHDFELAAGFLLAEALVDDPSSIKAIRYCTDPELDGEQRYNVVTADVGHVSTTVTERLVTTSSSCGICGTASLQAIQAAGHPRLDPAGAVSSTTLSGLPDLLSQVQAGFRTTGGLHGAALVGFDGELLVAREDIGRHNAVDKVIGWALLRGCFPLTGTALVVSGRTSFEIVQKALRAGICFVAAVSAASSLATDLARSEGMTLVGFVRGERFTVYSGPDRISFA